MRADKVGEFTLTIHQAPASYPAIPKATLHTCQNRRFAFAPRAERNT